MGRAAKKLALGFWADHIKSKTMLTVYIINTICLYLGLNLTVVFPLAAIIGSNPTRKSLLETQGIVAFFSAAVVALAM
jgi:hypothetical protein